MGWKESQPNTSTTRLMGITRLNHAKFIQRHQPLNNSRFVATLVKLHLNAFKTEVSCHLLAYCTFE